MTILHLGFFVSLGLAILKLLGLGVFATLSWWWVAAPLLLAIGIWVAIIAIIWLIAFIIAAISNW